MLDKISLVLEDYFLNHAVSTTSLGLLIACFKFLMTKANKKEVKEINEKILKDQEALDKKITDDVNVSIDRLMKLVLMNLEAIQKLELKVNDIENRINK